MPFSRVRSFNRGLSAVSAFLAKPSFKAEDLIALMPCGNIGLTLQIAKSGARAYQIIRRSGLIQQPYHLLRISNVEAAAHRFLDRIYNCLNPIVIDGDCTAAHLSIPVGEFHVLAGSASPDFTRDVSDVSIHTALNTFGSQSDYGNILIIHLFDVRFIEVSARHTDQ